MKKLTIWIVIFLAMAIFALTYAAFPPSVPEYKKSTGYKMGFQAGKTATENDCLWLQADFNIKHKAWLNKDMSNNYLQGCLDAQHGN